MELRSAVHNIIDCCSGLTLPVPLIFEMRLRQIGRRIIITLKLMGRAGALAMANASCKDRGVCVCVCVCECVYECVCV